jgi:hypothetical protein
VQRPEVKVGLKVHFLPKKQMGLKSEYERKKMKCKKERKEKKEPKIVSLVVSTRQTIPILSVHYSKEWA